MYRTIRSVPSSDTPSPKQKDPKRNNSETIEKGILNTLNSNAFFASRQKLYLVRYGRNRNINSVGVKRKDSRAQQIIQLQV